MSIITLMTDFGLKDGNVGVMKGIILGIAPQTEIVDISHFIPPQDIGEAALILLRSAPYFPEGTIHVVVVDPGVGTERRPMAARLGTQYYVGPDNGTLTLLLEYAEDNRWPMEFVRLDQPKFWLERVSNVFHGRDIFAPVAANLARGRMLAEVGTAIGDPMRLKLPKPKRTFNGWQGEVIHIDHFGNIATNLRSEHLSDGNPKQITVHLAEVTITDLVQTFGERPPGEVVSLFGSTGNLIISVVNGNAARQLGVNVGDAVTTRVV